MAKTQFGVGYNRATEDMREAVKDLLETRMLAIKDEPGMAAAYNQLHGVFGIVQTLKPKRGPSAGDPCDHTKDPEEKASCPDCRGTGKLV